jgi:Methyltransferase domain
VRFLSLNANKRLGGAEAWRRLALWLEPLDVHALFIQEPVSAGRAPESWHPYELVEGDAATAVWVRHGVPVPRCHKPAPFVQRAEFEHIAAYNVYLDARSSTRRTAQLQELGRLVAGEALPVVLAGDFNLAPRLGDGLWEGVPSGFTAPSERLAFEELLELGGLADVLATSPPEFTFERTMRGARSRFRCDVALITATTRDDVHATYEHETRTMTPSISDHSAILIDIPGPASGDLTMPACQPPSLDVGDSEGDLVRPSQPQATAIKRRGPSSIARRVVSSLVQALNAQSILDYGCGHGADVLFYREHGLQTEGYDPPEPFGFSALPRGTYDVVTVVFVLNVIADRNQRLNALRSASSFMRNDGRLVVATRSYAEIESQARAGTWPRHSDGYWSSTSKRTFQRGFTVAELAALGRRAGLVPAEPVPSVPKASTIALRRAGASNPAS